MGQSGSRKVYAELSGWIKTGEVANVRAFLVKLSVAQGSRSNDKELQALKGIDLNKLDPDGHTPLQEACIYNQQEIVQLLLQVPGLDPNVLDKEKRTALHYAARNTSPPRCGHIVQMLLRAGADPCIAAADDTTPLDMARKVSCLACMRLLEERQMLWQGTVDYWDALASIAQFQSAWRPKRLVILRDRRPNTGRLPRAQLQCSRCSHVQNMPEASKALLNCTSCGAEIQVACILQMEVYDPSAGGPNPVLDHARKLPQDPRQITVESLARAAPKNSINYLRELRVKRAWQSLSGSGHGLVVKVLSIPNGPVADEYSFRFASEEDRQAVSEILGAPVEAACRPVAPLAALGDAPTGTPTPPPLPVPAEAAAAASASAPAVAPPAEGKAVQQAGTAVASSADAWSCGVCTFRHEGELTKLTSCTMCDAPRSQAAVMGMPVDGHAAAAAQALRPGPGAAASAAPAEPQPPAATAPPKVVAAAAPAEASTAPAAKVAEPEAEATTAAAAAVPAASLSAATDSATASSSDGAGGAEDDAGMCVVCLEKPADSAVVPCGHMCGCHECLTGIKGSKDPVCPMCRGPMSSTIRIYRS